VEGEFDYRAALTFDDGPSEWTDAVVEELCRHGARATFFVLGDHIAGREEILRRAVSAGCEIAIHGRSHRRLTELSNREIRDEMTFTAALIRDVTGRTPSLWRAPRLSSGWRVRAVCGSLGLREVWLTADTEDYKRETEQVVERAIAGLQPGAIILMHDGRASSDSPQESLPDRRGTVAALPRILVEAKHRGLRMVTVSEVANDSAGAIALPHRSLPAQVWGRARRMVKAG